MRLHPVLKATLGDVDTHLTDANSFPPKVRQFMLDENVRIAWNAAYWLLRSEARRQMRSTFPDCDWKQIEISDECVEAVVEAQARICFRAMRGSNLIVKQYT
jgi:hypothetical protein